MWMRRAVGDDVFPESLALIAANSAAKSGTWSLRAAEELPGCAAGPRTKSADLVSAPPNCWTSAPRALVTHGQQPALRAKANVRCFTPTVPFFRLGLVRLSRAYVRRESKVLQAQCRQGDGSHRALGALLRVPGGPVRPRIPVAQAVDGHPCEGRRDPRALGRDHPARRFAEGCHRPALGDATQARRLRTP
jgi:hypothetical protein